MRPGTSRNPNKLNKEIGPAVQLFVFLVRFVPPEWTGDKPAWVAGGNAVSDAELAERLGVSHAVIAKWRTRLRNFGLLGWLVSPGNGRAFWVAGANRFLLSGVKKEFASKGIQKQSAPSPVPAIWHAIEERSIALTGKVVEDLTAAEGAQLALVLSRGSEILRETESQ